MDNEQYLCLLDTPYLLSLCSHRVDAQTIDWLKQNGKYYVLADLIVANGSDGPMLQNKLAKIRDNYFHLLTA